MKKVKEGLLFLAILIIPIVLFFIIFPFLGNMLSSSPSLVGVGNYIRMFLNDKTFLKVLLNTFLKPALVGFLLVLVFAVIVFLVKKKIKVPRWAFYLGSVIVGGVTTLIYNVYLSISLSRITGNLLYATQTILTHIADYKPSVFDIINPTNVLFSLYTGILTAFVFWILELMVDIVKNFRRKRNTK